jgi:endonuclease/exonuclease/phosphatase family metal-dependent hydrolase
MRPFHVAPITGSVSAPDFVVGSARTKKPPVGSPRATVRRSLLAVPVALSLGLGLLPATALAAPVPAVSSASSVTERIATFNVRTARATSDKRTWLQRAPDVAREIMTRRPKVVLLQELGPGRADGKTGTLKGHVRQTDSLLSALQDQGGGYYKLVRNTSYFAPGTPHGTQGARILYDSRSIGLVTTCPNMTGKHAYSTSCAFDLPIASGDSKELLRSAAYAELVDRRDGQHFFAVSAHLDTRHSGNDTTEAKYNAVRSAQARAVVAKLAKVNPENLPVVFGGDLNSWRNDRGDFAPHRTLVGKGFVDTAATKNRINYAYPTINHFATTLAPSTSKDGGVHLDAILTRGATKVSRWENMMAPVDSARPSDHNRVLADIQW